MNKRFTIEQVMEMFRIERSRIKAEILKELRYESDNIPPLQDAAGTVMQTTRIEASAPVISHQPVSDKSSHAVALDSALNRIAACLREYEFRLREQAKQLSGE